MQKADTTNWYKIYRMPLWKLCILSACCKYLHWRRRDADKIRSVRTMKDLLPHFPRWVAEADPREVKFHLSRLFKMTAYPNKKIKVEFL